jgi:hypothetical protein
VFRSKFLEDPAGKLIGPFASGAGLFASPALAKERRVATVFADEEHVLAAVAGRHAKVAEYLLKVNDFLDDADFHSHMAAECLFKAIFCNCGARA